jgi:hypothetical protein
MTIELVYFDGKHITMNSFEDIYQLDNLQNIKGVIYGILNPIPPSIIRKFSNLEFIRYTDDMFSLADIDLNSIRQRLRL